MQNSLKIAISIPKGSFKKIEELRNKMGIGRSALINKAIRFWLEYLEREKLIKQYEDGYKKIPEEVSDLRLLEKAEIEVLNQKERW